MLLRSLVLALLLAGAAIRFVAFVMNPVKGTCEVAIGLLWLVLVLVMYRLLSRRVARLGGIT